MKTEMQVPLEAAKCSKVRKVVSRLASETLRDPPAVEDIELATGEAFSNAVKYGADGKASVRIDASQPDTLSVEMCYLGTGFDMEITPPEDLENADGGFGRYIMQQVLDGMDYSFEDGRTTLRMSKRRR